MLASQETKPRWERRKDARPQELLAAALNQFVERGYAGTRLEDVAKSAGVSKGTLYLYFANKEELFKAVVRENIVHPIGEAELEAAQHDGPSGALLRAILFKWWHQICATPLAGITKLMLSEGNHFPELAQFYNEEVVARGNRLIASVLVRGIERGEFHPVDPLVMTPVLVAPVLMLMMWTHAYMPDCGMPPIDPDAFMATFTEVSLRGLEVRPA
ncbi:TetR family transcriptional regulator [Pseudoduganella danionis]|uniref:TetR family transcriptional regulator n=1 Tax=Pseudoduganella danionis TaxID=1890295 RepID=A0ABW9SKM6_9BURK|nr:TetR/AcrR family transcriptional regulator [Pseudoduganella danionis]MTW31284.1 TetR family transcriptional regulator [Pseudoduganella danionis]